MKKPVPKKSRTESATVETAKPKANASKPEATPPKRGKLKKWSALVTESLLEQDIPPYPNIVVPVFGADRERVKQKVFELRDDRLYESARLAYDVARQHDEPLAREIMKSRTLIDGSEAGFKNFLDWMDDSEIFVDSAILRGKIGKASTPHCPDLEAEVEGQLLDEDAAIKRYCLDLHEIRLLVASLEAAPVFTPATDESQDAGAGNGVTELDSEFVSQKWVIGEAKMKMDSFNSTPSSKVSRWRKSRKFPLNEIPRKAAQEFLDSLKPVNERASKYNLTPNRRK